MTVEELTKKIVQSSKNRTQDQRLRLLRNAKIIDENGNFCKGYFSAETLKKQRQAEKITS